MGEGHGLDKRLPEVLSHPNYCITENFSHSLFIHRRNLVESVTKQYLKKCTYHKVTDSLCPVFELGYIVKESGQNFTFLAVKVLQFQVMFFAVDGRGTLAVQASPAVEMIFCFLKNA